MKDALGNEIVIGNTYGYSTSNNGINKVTIGVAKNLPNDSKVSLTVLSVKDCYSDNEMTPREIGKPTVTVYAKLVFPVRLSSEVVTQKVDSTLMGLKFTHITNGQSFIIDRFDEEKQWPYHTTWNNEGERWYSADYLKAFENDCWTVEKMNIEPTYKEAMDDTKEKIAKKLWKPEKPIKGQLMDIGLFAERVCKTCPNNTSKDKIKLLEKEIIDRDELIFTMIRGNSFGYQHFMMNHSIGIPELKILFKVEEAINRPINLKRINLLHQKLFEYHELK